jgi:hypothetical protein
LAAKVPPPLAGKNRKQGPIISARRASDVEPISFNYNHLQFLIHNPHGANKVDN